MAFEKQPCLPQHSSGPDGSLTTGKLGILLPEIPSKAWVQGLKDRDVMAGDTGQQSQAISRPRRVLYAYTKSPPQSSTCLLSRKPPSLVLITLTIQGQPADKRWIKPTLLIGSGHVHVLLRQRAFSSVCVCLLNVTTLHLLPGIYKVDGYKSEILGLKRPWHALPAPAPRTRHAFAQSLAKGKESGVIATKGFPILR